VNGPQDEPEGLEQPAEGNALGSIQLKMICIDETGLWWAGRSKLSRADEQLVSGQIP
jgi:hypothetical protein